MGAKDAMETLLRLYGFSREVFLLLYKKFTYGSSVITTRLKNSR